MRSFISALGRLRKEQSGFTLIEFMVAGALGIALLGVALGFYVIAINGQTRAGARAEAVGQQQIGLERITRDLRQASRFYSIPTATTVEFDTYVRAGDGTAARLRRVRYVCNSSTAVCSRAEGAVNGVVGTAVPVITGVRNDNAFSPNNTTIKPTFMSVTVDVEAKARGNTRPVTLTDGVQLRNVI